MFGELMRGWARRRYVKDLEAHIRHLRKLSDEDMGLVVAITAHHRNALKAEGMDLFQLEQIAREQPMYQHELSKAVGVFIRSERPHDALGMRIWMHSLRAVAAPELMPLATDMWSELARGFPHIAAARETIRDEADIELDIARANEVPAVFKARGD